MSFVGKWFGFGQNEDFDRGLSAYEQQRFAEAAAHFKECSLHESNDRLREKSINYLAGSLTYVGKAALLAGDYESAKISLGDACSARPRFADTRMHYGTALYHLGEIDSATEQFERALEVNPSYAIAAIRLAACWAKKGRIVEATELARKAAEKNHDLENDTFKQAMASNEAEQFAALMMSIPAPAADEVRELIEAGDFAMKENRFSEAVEIYKRAIGLAPSYADVHCRLGQAYYESGKLLESIAEYENAIAINSKFGEAYSLKGITLRRMGREEEAVRCFHEALMIDPNNLIAGKELTDEEEESDEESS